MKKSLLSTGTGWDLYLPKPLLKLIGFIPKEDKFLLTVENSTLIISKIDPAEIDNYNGFMVKSLSKCGSGWSFYMPITLLELLGINPETDLVEYEVNGQILKVKKAQ